MRRGNLKGFEGMITRVVKMKESNREHFIKGLPDTSFGEALQNSWPFTDHKITESWKIVTPSGEDITEWKLSGHEGTVIVEFL
ncbi:MAG: hypothetical protein RTU92_05860 [Candidatus Thorarchaeota archaeon]